MLHTVSASSSTLMALILTKELGHLMKDLQVRNALWLSKLILFCVQPGVICDAKEAVDHPLTLESSEKHTLSHTGLIVKSVVKLK